jgi:peroxiredoxin
LAAFNSAKGAFDEVDASILAASADTLENASRVQEELGFRIAYGVTRDQAAAIGGWWEDRRSIIQPSEFILDRNGSVISATYSTGPVGRLMPEDALKLITFMESRKSKH